MSTASQCCSPLPPGWQCAAAPSRLAGNVLQPPPAWLAVAYHQPCTHAGGGCSQVHLVMCYSHPLLAGWLRVVMCFGGCGAGQSGAVRGSSLFLPPACPPTLPPACPRMPRCSPVCCLLRCPPAPPPPPPSPLQKGLQEGGSKALELKRQLDQV